jgi:spore coat polysaccharide biosynthesis protein SpsF (cytidylyltransferase family)
VEELTLLYTSDERLDTRENRSAFRLSGGISVDDSRSDFNLISNLKDTLENRSSSNSSLELIDLLSGSVDIERSEQKKEKEGKF